MGIYPLVEVEEVKGIFWISKDQAAVKVGDVRIIHELKRDSQYGPSTKTPVSGTG